MNRSRIVDESDSSDSFDSDEIQSALTSHGNLDHASSLKNGNDDNNGHITLDLTKESIYNLWVLTVLLIVLYGLFCVFINKRKKIIVDGSHN